MRTSTMNRFGKYYDNGNFLLRSYGDSMVVARAAYGDACDAEYITTKKSDVLGPAGRLMSNSPMLKTGVFKKSVAANSVHVPVSADCAHYTLPVQDPPDLHHQLRGSPAKSRQPGRGGSPSCP